MAATSGWPASSRKARAAAALRADRVVVSRSGALQEIRLPAKPAPDGIVKVR